MEKRIIVSYRRVNMVASHFRYIDNKDLNGRSEPFHYDAELFELFSNITGGLKGRSYIEPFLKAAMMAKTTTLNAGSKLKNK
jgi:hypothetical protein